MGLGKAQPDPLQLGASLMLVVKQVQRRPVLLPGERRAAGERMPRVP